MGNKGNLPAKNPVEYFAKQGSRSINLHANAGLSGVVGFIVASHPETKEGIMSLLEILKKDFEQMKNELDGEVQNNRLASQIEREAYRKGMECVHNNAIEACADGVVDAINQNIEGIEIYMDDGSGYGIRFNFAPIGYETMVHPEEEVRKGQVLIKLEDNSEQIGLQVYAFSSEMLSKLDQLKRDKGFDFPDDLSQ